MRDDGAPLLEAKNLSLERLWTNLSFALHPGGLLQITGDNGAGKSSLLAVLCGLVAPSRGEVSWRRRNIRAAAEDYFADMVYIGHKNGIKDALTPLENLRIAAALRCGAPLLPPHRALEKIGFAEADKLCSQLSAGQKRRVALARLLLNCATLWFLDEPYAGLDSDGRLALDEILAAHLSAGGVAVMATHHPEARPSAQILRLERS